MNSVTLEKKELKRIIKQSIKEVLKEERLNMLDLLIPEVSEKEMLDIKKRYGSPSKYKKEDFKDLTDWVNR
ncbi:MAG: hypothetical protein ACRDFC_05095 [Ignavibacteria bacterium]